MSGDYSRQRFDARKDYRGVMLQQGRVQLDADWNEQVQLSNRLARVSTLDTLGPCIVPSTTPDAFAIRWNNGQLTIGPGRMYVDGILIENHGSGEALFDSTLEEYRNPNPILFSQQPFAAPPAALAEQGRFLVYVDVWHREVTYLEDPDLVEKALGFDTTTRQQAVWQVRIHSTPLDTQTCGTPNNELPDWLSVISPSAGRLSSFIEQQPTETGPCILPPTPGYRGLDNRLYRVQIHTVEAGNIKFKWSRDNASCGARVLAVSDSQSIVVDDLGRDEAGRFKPGDWLELTSDADEFAFRPGSMHKIESVDPDSQRIHFTSQVTGAFAETSAQWLRDNHARARRWDQRGGQVDANGGLLPVQLDGTRQALEDGIEVVFHLDAATGNFHVGDYWLLAARCVDRSIEKLDQAVPHGPHHHYGRLAIVQPPDQASDCRQFWPLPHLALRYIGGDGQEEAAGTELPCPLVVGVEDQRARPQSGVLVRFSDQGSGDTLTDASDPANTGPSIVVATDANGQAQVRRILSDQPGCHDVEVRLELPPPQGQALSLRMEARVTQRPALDKPIRLNEVLIAGKPFFNDRVVPIGDFLGGVKFFFSEPMSPLAFANQIPFGGGQTLPSPSAVIFTVELLQTEVAQAETYFGHRTLILAGKMEATDPNNTVWRFLPNPIPLGVFRRWITEQNKVFRETLAIRCRMELKGNFLFDASATRWLDGDAFTVSRNADGNRIPQFEELTWVAIGDERPGGTVEGWFWLTLNPG